MKKILIIEDEKKLSEILKMRLEKEDFAVYVAYDGESGLDLALSLKPDLILLDVVLPKMDGMTVLKKLRNENSWGENVRIMMLSNFDPKDDTVNKSINDNEPSYYLLKVDFDLEEVVNKVKEVVS